MNKLKRNLIGIITPLLILSACFAEKTPLEVSQAFWASVISHDLDNAVKYSSLENTQQYDGFSQNWSQSQVTWGKIIIDGKQASVETVITRPGSPQPDNQTFNTYLLQLNNVWTVDYEKTRQDMQSTPLSNLFNQLSQIGEGFTEKLKDSSQGFSQKMERMTEELGELSDSISEEAAQSMEQYAEALSNSLEELAISIERSLEEQKDKLTEQERRTLIKIRDELKKDSQELSEPNLESIANGSKSIARAKLELEIIDDKKVGQYKKQWQEWEEKFESDMKKLLDELSSAKQQNPQRGI